MQETLTNLGINSSINFTYNQPRGYYVQETVRRGHGRLSKDGALIVETGKHTGRSANDRYIVKSETTDDTIWWENNLNPMAPETFTKLKTKVIDNS